MSVQKYIFGRCKLHFDPHICLCGAKEHPDGNYVREEDYAALLASHTRLVEALKECRKVLTVDNEYSEDSGSVIAIDAALREAEE